jgi:hypothetical protein
MKKTDGGRELKIEGGLVDLDERFSANHESHDESLHPALIVEDDIEAQDDTSFLRADAAIVEFISLVVDFLDHSADKAHSERAKLYMKMNFTEWVTYAIKVLPVFDWCAPFLSEEVRIFATTEDGFLDTYMAEVCRTIRKLWLTDLKGGYGEIVDLDDVRLAYGTAPAPWKLATSVHIDYLATLGIKVTPAVISQHRKKFNELKEQLENVK